VVGLEEEHQERLEKEEKRRKGKQIEKKIISGSQRIVNTNIKKWVALARLG